MTTDQMFELWWSEYPKKVAKKDAHKAWMSRKVDEALFDVIMGATRAQIEFAWVHTDRQYIPHPASWLRGERENDEVPDFVDVARVDRRFHRCDAVCAESGCVFDPIHAVRRGMRSDR